MFIVRAHKARPAILRSSIPVYAKTEFNEWRVAIRSAAACTTRAQVKCTKTKKKDGLFNEQASNANHAAVYCYLLVDVVLF